jgi:hypothetical protein
MHPQASRPSAGFPAAGFSSAGFWVAGLFAGVGGLELGLAAVGAVDGCGRSDGDRHPATGGCGT